MNLICNRCVRRSEDYRKFTRFQHLIWLTVGIRIGLSATKWTVNMKYIPNFLLSVKLIYFLACECYDMTKYCFEDKDLYGALDWAIQTYNKWLDGRPKCVDIEKLHFYIKSGSVPTGITITILLEWYKINSGFIYYTP